MKKWYIALVVVYGQGIALIVLVVRRDISVVYARDMSVGVRLQLKSLDISWTV
jgi:hypothetical protein